MKPTQELYEYIADYMVENQHQPAIKEMMVHFNVGRTTVDAWLADLQGQKLIERIRPGVYLVRGIVYTDCRDNKMDTIKNDTIA